MHENFIFMHENFLFSCNGIFKHENENFAPAMNFSPQKCSWVVVHSFMHGILTHENLRAKFSFPCMEISFTYMKFPFSCMKFSFSRMKMKFSCMRHFERKMSILGVKWSLRNVAAGGKLCRCCHGSQTAQLTVIP